MNDIIIILRNFEPILPALVALSPGTELSLKIDGNPATLKVKILKSPPVAAADTDAATAMRLKIELSMTAAIDALNLKVVLAQL